MPAFEHCPILEHAAILHCVPLKVVFSRAALQGLFKLRRHPQLADSLYQ